MLGGAALIGPLAAYPTLARPKLAIMLCVLVVAGLLASRSVAYPLALFSIPGVAIALIGPNVFPDNSVEITLVAWLVAGILLTLIVDENALPFRLIFSGPVLLTLGLAVVMLGRLGASTEPGYGSHKLQLFLGDNVAFLVAGILIARTRKNTNIWSGLTLAALSLGA